MLSDASSTVQQPPGSPLPSGGGRRWGICFLLFFATTILYYDRAVLSNLKPYMTDHHIWSEEDYANIVASFSFTYAIGYLLAGRALDRLGVKVGYALVVGLWSLAVMGNGLVRSVLGFQIMRGAMGLPEGGTFPAAVKSVGEWFPKRERALATGLFNAGSNVGVIVAPILVPWFVEGFGWPSAFYFTAALGVVWLVAWHFMYEAPERHQKLSPVELAYIQSDRSDPAVHVPWLHLLPHPQVWAFIVGMALSGPIWWFYLYWAPDFFHKRFGIDMKHLGWPLVTVYLMADVGSVGGGWLSSSLIKRGWTVNAARKTAMLVCALCVVPVYAAATVTSAWTAVGLIGLAAAAHQGFSANLYTLVSDTAPRAAVSSIVGMGGMAAGFAAMGFQVATGRILKADPNDYTTLLAIASGAYLVNLAIIHALNPRLAPMKFAIASRPTDV